MMNSCSRVLTLICAFMTVTSLITGCEQAHINPPLTIKMRESYVSGYVLQITNRASKHLECTIYVIDKKGKKSQTHRYVINSGQMKEFGFLELNGRYLEAGDKIIISAEGYVRRMYATLIGGEKYNYGYYDESD